VTVRRQRYCSTNNDALRRVALFQRKSRVARTALGRLGLVRDLDSRSAPCRAHIEVISLLDLRHVDRVAKRYSPASCVEANNSPRPKLTTREDRRRGTSRSPKRHRLYNRFTKGL
jgi:hypothetical protein